jgi:hypothetical protein
MEPFLVKDCTLLIRMSGLNPAFNLRELRDRIACCSPDVIYHHFCETLLAPTFDYPDFRNDFALWVKRQLEENVLAERLGVIDPYGYPSLETLRADVLDILDERINEMEYLPSVSPGHEFHFREAVTVVFETGERLLRPEDMPGAIEGMTKGSVYFHFLEARRRTESGLDDFSLWLEEWGEPWLPAVGELRTIDFLFQSLTELRSDLVRVLTPLCRKEPS